MYDTHNIIIIIIFACWPFDPTYQINVDLRHCTMQQLAVGLIILSGFNNSVYCDYIIIIYNKYNKYHHTIQSAYCQAIICIAQWPTTGRFWFTIICSFTMGFVKHDQWWWWWWWANQPKVGWLVSYNPIKWKSPVVAVVVSCSSNNSNMRHYLYCLVY